MIRRPATVTPGRAIWMPLALALVAAVAGAWLLETQNLFAVSSAQGTLVGDALLGSSGKADAGEMLASYPPVALLPLIALQAPTGLAGLTSANLFSACIAAGLAGLWLRGLMLAGFGTPWALAMTLLLVVNPLFVYALAEGPELMLAMAGGWIFAISAFAVRSRGGVNDLMLCSGSLMLLVFAGQSGLILAFATLPFLSLIMPTDIRARSWLNVYLVLLFPVVFALLGFALVNWMMLHDPLAFIRPQLEAPGEWFALSFRGAAIGITLAVATAPILLGLFILARGRQPVQAVALALLGTVMLLALLALQVGVSLSLTAALSPAIGLAAAAAMRWPAQQARALRAALLLALGFLGGISAIYAADTAVAAGSGISENRQDGADRRLGRFLRGRDGVMIDAAAHPQVIAARGSAEGLVTASETAFELAMLRRRLGDEALAVAVIAPDASRNADKIGRILPNFHAEGAPGFRLVYDRDGWRVWSRPSREGATP